MYGKQMKNETLILETQTIITSNSPEQKPLKNQPLQSFYCME